MYRVIITFFLLVSSTLAATITATRPAAQATIKAAVPRILAPATPPRAIDITNSITNWMASVNTVNEYLNNPQNTTKLQSAIVFAKDEPVQLATMMKATGLSKAGANSAEVLMGNFLSITSNLNSVQNGVMTTADATAAINFMRCCTVLPAIGSLWTAAANATKAPAPLSLPNLEQQCSQMSCASGASVNSTVASVSAIGRGGSSGNKSA